MSDQRFDVLRNMQIYMDKLVDHVRKNFRPNGRPRLCWYAQHPLADGKKALRRPPCVRLIRAMEYGLDTNLRCLSRHKNQTRMLSVLSNFSCTRTLSRHYRRKPDAGRNRILLLASFTVPLCPGLWVSLGFHETHPNSPRSSVMLRLLDKLGYNLPDPATVTLYKITPQLTSSDDFDAWEAMVVKQLRGLQLHNLIDDKVDRPDRDDPRWPPTHLPEAMLVSLCLSSLHSNFALTFSYLIHSSSSTSNPQ
ncbi:hypothetical protein N7527_011488 [Penicillium freii]|nr:hypothetical protein N7527_011488 [Penicillium freii]